MTAILPEKGRMYSKSLFREASGYRCTIDSYCDSDVSIFRGNECRVLLHGAASLYESFVVVWVGMIETSPTYYGLLCWTPTVDCIRPNPVAGLKESARLWSKANFSEDSWPVNNFFRWPGPVSPPKKAAFVFLENARRLAEKGRVDSAFDLIYEVIDRMMKKGIIAGLSAVIETVDPEGSGVDICVAVMAATIPMREKLPERKKLYEKLKLRLEKDGEDPADTLVGLD